MGNEDLGLSAEGHLIQIDALFRARQLRDVGAAQHIQHPTVAGHHGDLVDGHGVIPDGAATAVILVPMAAVIELLPGCQEDDGRIGMPFPDGRNELFERAVEGIHMQIVIVAAQGRIADPVVAAQSNGENTGRRKFVLPFGLACLDMS